MKNNSDNIYMEPLVTQFHQIWQELIAQHQPLALQTFKEKYNKIKTRK